MYINYGHAQTQAVITYNKPLEKFSQYLQQLEMESNGKSVNKLGEPIDYPTCLLYGVVRGLMGNMLIFKMLHQGKL